MQKVRAQIQELYKTESANEQHKMFLGVVRRMTELTVKGLAMDSRAVEKIVRTAVREPWNGPMMLTNSIKELLDARRLDVATAPVNLRRLQTVLSKRDHSTLGSDARQTDIEDLTLHLCNELNSLPPLSKPVLAFINQVNTTNALGRTTEEWTLDTWKNEFSAYDAKTPRGQNAVLSCLTQMHINNPSLACTARTEGMGTTQLVHRVAHNTVVDELRHIPSTTRGTVVRALFVGDYEGARSGVLRNRDWSKAETLIVGVNLDTSALDSAGLCP